MEIEALREPSQDGVTFGEWFVDGVPECLTLEDEIRDIDGVIPAGQKIHGETAIPSGRFRITLENSPRFGPGTITINNVPGFIGVRVHGGNTKEHTEGCPLVGDRINRETMTISGGRERGVLARLKVKIKAAIDRGEQVWLTIKNPEA